MTTKFIKTSPHAITPAKAHPTDSGFDISIISAVKFLGHGITLFDTGLIIAPEPGYYFDLVARSSLMKQGYVLANSVGIIDNSYRGNILVALRKIDDEAPILKLPVRVAQLIPRQVIPMEFQEVSEIDSTKRGDGGFGSTN